MSRKLVSCLLVPLALALLMMFSRASVAAESSTVTVTDMFSRSLYCDYPASVPQLPAVQSGANTNPEEILALNPQVVIMSDMAHTSEGEVVGLGRYAYSSGFLSARDDDGRNQVEKALELTGLTELRHASVLTLSGGELQRTFLAQNPQVLILDEPANHLDLVYQKHIFSLIGQWLKQPGRALMSVVHDLSLARRYGTHAVLLNHGRCAAQGEIGAALTPENLHAVYDMDVYEWMHEMLEQWQGRSCRKLTGVTNAPKEMNRHFLRGVFPLRDSGVRAGFIHRKSTAVPYLKIKVASLRPGIALHHSHERTAVGDQRTVLLLTSDSLKGGDAALCKRCAAFTARKRKLSA